ncbi:alkaline phosphatase [Sorangium cellulosum]|uniref:Alkaline phosphatase n=1 Tax=Sorangium cellulosum TaxID=56 RepID=A0A2L0ELQ3_SORCE|nr:alkaline phosphatase D family protein [Sorangium cellulosum]AUX40228.1 alkaline phosphatase [Sorangium cellulosum]
MSITRRNLLCGVSMLGVAALPGLPGCSGADPVDDEPRPASGGFPSPSSERSRAVFQHGVASGDPLADAVILWTRVTPVDGDAGVQVAWQLALDVDFTSVVGSGTLTTSAERDYTVKVDAGGLEAGTTYYYRFSALDGSSPVGRTRTAPSGGVERLRFAVASCSSYAHGFFHGYRHIAARLDLDAVIHLGDYLYEYGSGQFGGAREYEPAHEIVTLADYRARYAQYRRDRDLQAAHQQHPFIVVWDDHESANNAWKDGAQNHTEGSEGAWEARKATAWRVYAEWMPIREEEDGKLWRALRYGDLADILLLDTRRWGRDQQADASDGETIADPARTLLGQDQEAWLRGELARSTAAWKIIGQQVMMGQIPQLMNPDAWDGYPAARQRFFDILTEERVRDVVVLTGDIHSSWAIDLAPTPLDPDSYNPATGEGALAVEIVTPGITSPFLTESEAKTHEPVALSNPHIKYVNLWRRGYVVLDVTEERAQAAWFQYDAPERQDVDELFAAAFATRRGESHLLEEEAAAPDREDPPEAAPRVA